MVYITGTRSNADIADMKSLQNKERPIDIHSKKHKEKWNEGQYILPKYAWFDQNGISKR